MKTACPSCGTTFTAPDTFRGRRGKCPKCKHVFVVQESGSGNPGDSRSLAEGPKIEREPAPAQSDLYGVAEPTKQCPSCAETIHANAIKCRHCGESLNQEKPGLSGPPVWHRLRSRTPGTAPRASGLAVASLVFSLLGLSVLGLILGIIGMGKIKRSAGALTGYGLAVAGTVISAVSIPLQLLLVGPIVAGMWIAGSTQAKSGDISVTKLQLMNIESALELFNADMGRYPTADEGLEALSDKGKIRDADLASKWTQPYLGKAGVPRDPWGSPLNYKSPGWHNEGKFDLWSNGPDRQEGTYDDICNW